MSAALHSPTPWAIDEYGTVRDARGEPIVMSGVGSGSGSPERPANTRAMLRSVNAHGAAIDALREVSAEISRVNRAAGETIFNPAATAAVRAVLALVDGPLHDFDARVEGIVASLDAAEGRSA